MILRITLFFILLPLFYLYAETPEDSLKRVTEQNKLTHIDSLIYGKQNYFLDENNELISLNPNYDSIPVVDELIYEYRILQLNKTSAIKLNYNDIVKNYIEMYTVRKRRLLEKIITRSQIYFPIFEEYFDKYNLPLELKYLSIVESALNPNARSKSGAVGLWQFMYNTGKMLDLNITSFIDERKDIYKSTNAACRYLEYLYRTFGDWQLALAAYNGGPGSVRNAITLSGGKTNFWEIRKYLPKETQGYVPAYIAAFYAFEYSKEHNIKTMKNLNNYNNIDTLSINGNLSLRNVAKQLNLDYAEIKKLNPIYKLGVIPDDNNTYTIVLPKKSISQFLELNSSLVNVASSRKKVDIFNGKEKLIHIVEKGEYFHKIALHYRCTIEDIITWNKLEDRKIHTGQELVIYNTHLSETSILEYKIDK